MVLFHKEEYTELHLNSKHLIFNYNFSKELMVQCNMEFHTFASFYLMDQNIVTYQNQLFLYLNLIFYFITKYFKVLNLYVQYY